MIRITALFWIGLLVVAGATVMRVSYQVRHVQEHLAQLGHDIQREQDSVRVLNAEWETLNDPKRIDMLSKRYLSLESTPVRRVVALADIPFKPTAEQIAQTESAAAKKLAKARPASNSPVLEAKSVAPAPAPRPSVRVALPVTSPSAKGQAIIRIRAERTE